MTDLSTALVGAGRFATFIADVTRDLPSRAWRVVADPDHQRAEALASRLEVKPLATRTAAALAAPAVALFVAFQRHVTSSDIGSGVKG